LEETLQAGCRFCRLLTQIGMRYTGSWASVIIYPHERRGFPTFDIMEADEQGGNEYRVNIYAPPGTVTSVSEHKKNAHP
jgi:hypothetical protein